MPVENRNQWLYVLPTDAVNQGARLVPVHPGVNEKWKNLNLLAYLLVNQIHLRLLTTAVINSFTFGLAHTAGILKVN